MARVILLATVVTLLTIGGVQAATDHQALVREARTAMSRAATYFRTEIATHGGYLWRYKEDLSQREGEGRATPSQVWVQPPGTPSVGFAFLRAYQATGSLTMLQAAREACQALIWGQLACGGWDYLIDFDPEASKQWYYRRDKEAGREIAQGQRNRATFDDNNSQCALGLLMAVDQALGFRDRELHDAALYGLECVLQAQFDNGAWPQCWPLPPLHYYKYYTFNDAAINECISVLLTAYHTYGDQRYRQAALRGGDFIIQSQLPPPQAGWAQQYDFDMQPAWARWFEPPAVCTSVTRRNVRTLMELYRHSRDQR